jgi:hypothetical protein
LEENTILKGLNDEEKEIILGVGHFNKKFDLMMKGMKNNIRILSKGSIILSKNMKQS